VRDERVDEEPRGQQRDAEEGVEAVDGRAHEARVLAGVPDDAGERAQGRDEVRDQHGDRADHRDG